MNKEQRMVQQWHERFGVLVQHKPRNVDKPTQQLRYDLINEELKELLGAQYEGNLVGIADALSDLLYVVYGTAVSYGIDLEPCFREVHLSNMSKGSPEVVKAPNGKILKSKNYKPPKLKDIIENQKNGDLED
jgi:predicted HAD superfamily Cof-like phosphohydrolase